MPVPKRRPVPNRMPAPKRTAAVAILFAIAVVGLVSTDAKGDSRSELKDAQAEGEVLWKKSWKTGAKSCAACHERGKNKLTAARLNSYPKYDKRMKKVVTGQQKLNQMISKSAKGEPLELGSAELNALEAYIKSRK